MKKSEALKILGLSEGYGSDELKQAHRAKIRDNHPDRFTDPDEKKRAEEKTKLINEARDVLESGKWEPEYGPRVAYNPYTGNGNPYYSPYSGNGDPFTGTPFDFVWTSWDNIGGTGSGEPFDPFASSYTRAPRKTAEEELAEAQQALSFYSVFVLAKLVVVAVFVALAGLGGLAIGVSIYVIATVGYALYSSFMGCGRVVGLVALLFVVPMLFRFAPLLIVVSRTPMVLLVAGLALAYDISVLRKRIGAWRTAKEKVKVSDAA